MTNDEDFKRSMKLIDEYFEKNKPPTLKERLIEWAYIKNSVRPDFDSVDEILIIVEKWILPSSSSNSYGWEKCLKVMRDKLR